MARRERYFNRVEFDKELRSLEIKMSAYNSYLHYCSKIKEGASSIDEVERHLNSKTGFVNPRMSADAMGVLEDYSKAIDLENTFMGIDMSAIELTKSKSGRKVYKIRPDYLDLLKEKHTTYYTAEQSRALETMDKAIEMLNGLDTPYKTAIGYSQREQKFVWAKQQTDNNLRETKVRF